MSNSETTSEALRSNRFERILEAATDGIVMLDRDGRYTYANPAAEKILGVSRESILQRTFDQAEWRLSTVRGAPLSDEETPFRRVLHEKKGVYGLKAVIERPDGEKVVISTSAAPLYDAAGQFDGMVGVFTDVTELHELQEHDAAFHHTIAHDLRAPLTTILEHVETLNKAFRKGGIVGTVWQVVEAIEEGARKMESVIHDLVDSARIEGGHVPLEKKPIVLEDFVWFLLRSAEETLDPNRVATRIPQNLPPLMADPERLERILINLLGNALKFSPPDRQVILQAHQADGEIMISVTDQGVGIAPEDCSRLFKRFFQVGGRKPSGGVGLGLYISRLLVEAHGGRIWVVSKLGEGSTFYVTFPTK